MIDDKLPSETIDIDPSALGHEPSEVDNGDGTTTIAVDGAGVGQPAEFYSNLALTLPDDVLDGLAEKYLHLIEADREARKQRDKQYAEGLKKTGIAEPAPGGATFPGASRATHPVLAEAYVDFAATAIKELFPPNGPVKTKIEGKADHRKMEKAERKCAFMNWQLTTQIKGYRSELEKLLTQLPPGGTQFKKIFWSEDKGRIDVEFVPIDNFILPYNAKNFFDCQRKFHRMELSPLDMDRRVQSGVYRDWSLPPASGANFSETEAEKQTAKIEGKGDNYQTEDQDRIVYEGDVFDNIEGDDKAGDKPVPYLITIDNESRKVLAIYRNWVETDQYHAEIDHTVDYNFIPWRGALAIGLIHLIGGLSDTLTGALRALLDSALIANSATCLKLKGPPSGNNNSIEMTQATEIDAMGADDVRKIAMPLPFPGPSPVLFELLGFVTAAAKSVVTTAEEKIADASNTMPVGTALALIEQGAKVFSAIHARLHDSQRRVLEIIHRLNKDHLPEKFQFGTNPDDYVLRADFDGPMDVRPVSDPNIFSESQRLAQIQFILQLIEGLAPIAPQVPALGINLHALLKRALEQIKFPDFAEILPDAPQAAPLNPVDENVALSLGKPVKAFQGQDHQAHIQVHGDFAQSPYFGQSPAMNPNFMANMLNHIQDHLLTFYEEMMKTEAGVSSGLQPQMLNDPAGSEALAKASPVVGKAVEIAFEKLPPLMQQGAQMAKQKAMENAPKDPRSAVMAQKVQADAQHNQAKLAQDAKAQQTEAQLRAAELQEETKRHGTELQAKAQENQSRTALEAQEMQGDVQLQLAEIQKEMQLKGMELSVDQRTALRDALIKSHTELAKTRLDNKTAIEIAEMNNKAEKVKNGESLTPDKRGDA